MSAREPRMSDTELAESVATFCDEAEESYAEAQAALLDSPDIEAGALHYTERHGFNNG